jgi:hypothetical protein
MWGGGAAQAHRRRHAAMVTTAEFREVSAARSERRSMELSMLQLPSGAAARRAGGAARRGAHAALRQHSVMLSDLELGQLEQLREAAAAYHPGAAAPKQLVGAPGGGHRPRSAAGTRGAVTNPARAQANFTAVAHLYHANSNRSSVAWEAGLRR